MAKSTLIAEHNTDEPATGVAASRQYQLEEVRRVHQLLRQDRISKAWEEKTGRPAPSPANDAHGEERAFTRKARGDVIAKYRHAGKLNDLQVRAAEEVLEVHAALQRSLFSPTDFTPRVQAGGGGRKGGKLPAKDMIDRLRPREARLFWDTYRPWSLEMGRQIYSGHPHLAIIMAIVGDNWTIAQVEKIFKLRKGGPAMKILREGLARYAEIAGVR